MQIKTKYFYFKTEKIAKANRNIEMEGAMKS
jgi:hypothetical protein